MYFPGCCAYLAIRAIVGSKIWGAAENGTLLLWEMHFRRPDGSGRGQAQLIRGASHLRFDAAGKVVWHRDYWDAAEELYEKLPGIGWLMRLLKRRLAA